MSPRQGGVEAAITAEDVTMDDGPSDMVVEAARQGHGPKGLFATKIAWLEVREEKP